MLPQVFAMCVHVCVIHATAAAAVDAAGDFNEPYYRNYVSCDFGAMFSDAGFQPETKYFSGATKTLSFIKPQ